MIRSLMCPFKVGSRYWCLYWIRPRTYWNAVREFCQRGKRGYADTDVWNFCDYLTEWLPDAIKLLREKGRTYPGEACKGAATPEEWRERLKEIEEGFRAARVLTEEIPSEYFTGSEYVPVEIRVPGLQLAPSRERMCRNPEQYRQQLWRKFRRGIVAFYKYYFYLWD